MDVRERSEQPVRRGLPAGYALAVAVCGLVLLVAQESIAKARDGSDIPGGADSLNSLFMLAALLAAGVGLAIASIRRSIGSDRRVGGVAGVMCLAGIAWVAMAYARVLLK